MGPYWAVGGARSMTFQGLIFSIQLKARISNHTRLVGPFIILKQLCFTVATLAAVPKSMLLCLQTTLTLGPLLSPTEANTGPIEMGPPCLINKAQLDKAV